MATGLGLPKSFGAGLPFPKGKDMSEERGLSRLGALAGLPLCQTIGPAFAEMDGQRAGSLQAFDGFHGIADGVHLETHALLSFRACAWHTGQRAKQTVKIDVS